jgi:hypothetical protein
MMTFRSRTDPEVDMDIEAYRKDFLAQVERESATAETVSPDTMISYANTDDRDNETLCGMIRGLSLAPASFAASVRSLLEVLANDSLAAAPRLAALEQLGAAQFQPVEFAPFHAEFTEILRRLAFAKDKAIRTAALERLTLANDETAQRLLREGLEKTRKPLVSDAKAVQLLARDEHARPLPLLRKLATERTGAVREQALRALAGDSKSISLFETIAGDKSETAPIRQIAAVNLKNTSSSRFAELAQNLLLDDGDDDQLRTATANAIAHTDEVASKLSTRAFSAAVDALGSRTRSRALKTSIGRLAKSLASK